MVDVAKNDPGNRAITARTHYAFLKIMTGSDLSRRRLPLMSMTAAERGPVVWVTACGHGDEVGGIIVIQELFRSLRRTLQKGEIHAFPLMNPLGFEAGSRTIMQSREDLNRSFPGNPNGSLGERIADRIFSKICETRPSLVLDLHNDWIESIPYILIDPPMTGPGEQARDGVIRFGKATGMCLIADPDELRSSLSHNLLSQGIPAMTLELGRPNVVAEQHVTQGVEAILNVLADLGMIAPRPIPFHYLLPPGFDGRLLNYSDKPYGSRTGIVRFLAKPGQVVTAGQPLAKIVNAFGKHQETIRSGADALVLGHSDSSAAFPGMPIMAFGIAAETAPQPGGILPIGQTRNS